MFAEWRDTTLGEVVNLKRGFDLPASSRLQGNVPIVSSSGISGFHAEAKINGPGVVTGRYGTIGTVHYCEGEYWPLNTTLFVEDFKGNYPKFIYYFLKTIDYQQYSDKGAVPGVNRNHLHTAKVCLPDLASQKEIAFTLSALDDKITLLRETNATLEAIAQALFKSWFVDFDPVRAKMAGRAPEGMDAATAALFPDSFEDSELGDASTGPAQGIPRGWRHSTVGQSFTLTMGQSPPGETYNTNGEGLPFYQGRTDFGFRFPEKRVYCTAPTRLAEVGDTLVSVRAPVGDVNMAIESCCLGRGVAGVRHPKGFRSFTFYALRGLRSKFDLHDAEGTVFGSINKSDFQSLQIIEPALPVLQAYSELASPLDSRIVENEEQIRTLVALRDTLLPRLMSGKLRLPEALQKIEGGLL